MSGGGTGAPAVGEGPFDVPGTPPQGLRDLYGHSPLDKMFAGADVYGTGYEPERAEREPLRVGVIGAGGVAQSKWLPALARLRTLWDPVRVAAVADPREAQGRKLEKIHCCRWYRDHHRMLEEEALDAVVVSSPDALHAAHVEDAVQAGVAALVEKPFCRSLGQAAALCRLAGQRATVVMPVCNLRFSPPLRRAREVAATSDRFSGPLSLVGRMSLGYDYVDLFEGATVHLLDLCRYFLGDASLVHARGLGRGAARHPYPCRQAMVGLDFEGGSLAQLFTSSNALSLKPWLRVEVHGDGSWLVVDDVLDLVVYDSETGPAKSWRPVMASTLVFDEEFGGYMPQLEHFLQVVRGQERPSVVAADGYKAVELVVATHLSLARGEPVRLPLVPDDADAELADLRARWGGR